MSIWEKFSGLVPAAATAAPAAAPAAPAEPAKEEPKDDPSSWFTADPDAKEGEEDKGPQINFGGDPEAILKEIGNLNFIGSIATPEVMGAISQGGEEGAKAAMEAMNAVARTALQGSYQMTERMLRQALSSSEPVVDARVKATLQEQRFSEAITAADPFFSKPEGQMVADGIKQALMSKFPNSSPAEITERAQKYLAQIRADGSTSANQEQAPSGNGLDFLLN